MQVALIKCLNLKYKVENTVISELAGDKKNCNPLGIKENGNVPSVGNQYGKDTGACNPSADSIEMDSSNPFSNQTCTCSKKREGKRCWGS